MAEKLLTLIQDTTGYEIYPNIKEDNLPPSVRGELQKIDTKQDKLTNTQMYAVNSGITQNKVATYDGYNTTITTLNNDLTDAINEINNKQDKIFTSTANPFVLTEDGTGIDLHKLQFTTNGILKIGDVVTQIPSDTYIQGELDNKQDTLVSGTNIKTLNGQSILGSGDLPISGGGESVSPTLILFDLTQGKTRTTITEQEKTNLEKGLYNQVVCRSSDENLGHFAVYLPSKLISFAGTNIFALMDVSGESPYIKQIEFYVLQIGEKNADGEYPITIQSGEDSGVPNMPFGTAINLFNHDIEINFEYAQNQSSYHVYLNVVSSKNLNVGNITDLKTLLGNTFRRSCTSGNDNDAQKEVIAISNDGFDFNNFSSILFSEVTNIIITDTVTTI